MAEDGKSDQDIVDAIRAYIKLDIPDPNYIRKKDHKEWVYDDEPLTSNTIYPRIAVTYPQNNSSALDVGFSKEKSISQIVVFVIVEKGATLRINNIEYRDLKVLDYLVEEVRKSVLTTHLDDLAEKGLYLLPPVSNWIQGDNTYGKYMRFTIKYFRDV